MNREGKTLSLAARGYLWGVALAGGVALALWLWAWRGPAGRPARPGPGDLALFFVLVATAVLAQHLPLHLGPQRKMDVVHGVYFAGLLLFGPPLGVALAGAGHLLGQSTLALRRNPQTGHPRGSRRGLLFNTGQMMLATALAGLAYYAVLSWETPAPLERPQNLWALPLAAAVLYLVNSFLVAGMVGLQAGASPTGDLARRAGLRRAAVRRRLRGRGGAGRGRALPLGGVGRPDRAGLPAAAGGDPRRPAPGAAPAHGGTGGGEPAPGRRATATGLPAPGRARATDAPDQRTGVRPADAGRDGRGRGAEPSPAAPGLAGDRPQRRASDAGGDAAAGRLAPAAGGAPPGAAPGGRGRGGGRSADHHQPCARAPAGGRPERAGVGGGRRAAPGPGGAQPAGRGPALRPAG